MAPAEQRDQQLVDDLVLADDDLADLFAEPRVGDGQPANGLGFALARFGGGRSVSGGGGNLLPGLVAIGQARGAAPDVTIEGITFREGVIEMRVIAADTTSIDAIGQQLRAANWSAKLSSVTAAGEGYRGSLQIRKAGA